MTNSLEDYQIKELLEAMTWENWFFQLRVIHDRFVEIGDNDKADRCMDLIVEKKRPRKGVRFYWWDAYSIDEWALSKQAAFKIDRINDANMTRSIQPQLTGYLQIPEKLRIPRTQVNNP